MIILYPRDKINRFCAFPYGFFLNFYLHFLGNVSMQPHGQNGNPEMFLDPFGFL